MSIENALYEIDRYLEKPLWKATEYFGKPGTISKIIGIFAAMIAAPFAIAWRVLRGCSQLYFQKEYLSYESTAPIAKGSPKKFMTFNVCMMPGILATLFGGMSPPDQRIDRLADFLKKQDVDIVCLQEMTTDPASQLINKLKDTYRYFYYRIGPNPLGMENALFWASKYPLVNKPAYIPFKVPNIQKGFRRGFFVAEIEDRYVITTHLDPHAGKGTVRAAEIQVILDYTSNLKKPLMLLGDLNIEPEDTEAHELLARFSNFKKAEVEHPNETNATCLDNISDVSKDSKTAPKYTVIDHILTSEVCSSIILKTFDPNKLHQALSDHHAVVLTLEKSNL